MSAPTVIPPIVHLVWFGPVLAPVAWLTARAALDRGDLSQVRLHLADGDMRDPLIRDLVERGVDVQPLDTLALLGTVEAAGLALPQVRARLEALRTGAARANLARLLIVWRDGGVYLDTDAPPLRSLRPLLDHGAFVGLERVALPLATMESRSPWRKVRAGLLLGGRQICTWGAPGERLARRWQHLLDLAVNNAVLGAPPRAPLLTAALQAADALPAATFEARYQLGPKLLERVTANRSGPDWQVLAPEVCYPFGPELSWHLFRVRSASEADPERYFPPETRVVHLYDSVLRRRTGASLDGAWLRRHRDTTLVGRLYAPWIDDLCALDAGRAGVAR